ncbi:MAG: phosphotransferase family protein [Spirochaetaceae bacterium]|nr:phosphotransferase family protein [Myxococcales bacterium]MCB9723589.1 phosphotransferase family protein [Spirochaetaceae bacterium]HPG26316.1 phosphotransferase family protein [Myxococcota bacterium]
MVEDGERQRAGAAVKGIRHDRVEAWYAAHVEGTRLPLRFTPITGGHSNLTFLVEDAQGRRTVLRRPPTGAVLATAHDMAREHRILAGLHGTAVPVPRPLALCEDDDVNDAPFYVMEHIAGDVLVSPEQTETCVPAARREALGLHVIDVLASLHRIDPDAVGLGDLGRREAYLERQLKRWRTQWEKSKTRELPIMEEVHAVLESRRPEQKASAIVHGDYRIGNFLSQGREGRIAAVLDWELCTLGDPLADLGYLMNDWNGPGDTRPTASGTGESAVSCGGFPSRERLLARYEETTGLPTRDIDYYRAFQYWRLAAIVEGVLARYQKGVMGEGGDTARFRAQVDALALAARDLACSDAIG